MAITNISIKLNHPPNDSAYGTDSIPTPEKPNKDRMRLRIPIYIIKDIALIAWTGNVEINKFDSHQKMKE